MKTAKNQSKTKNGFTLAEVLVAVAIIAILCAIGIPAVSHYQKKLTQMKVDQTAHDIYLSTQNKLSSLKALNILSRDTLDPRKQVLSLNSEVTDGYKYDSTKLTSTDPLYDALLTGLDGSYSVIFQMNTGSVYKVEYRDSEGNIGTYSGDGFDPGISQNFANDSNTRTVLIDVSVIENKALYLKVSPNDYFAYYPHYTYVVVITDCNGVDYSFRCGDPKGNGLIEISEEDLKSAGLCMNDLVTAKVDLTIALENGEYVFTDTKCTTNIAVFHPLFGSATNANTIEVSCQRHLENLSSFTKDSKMNDSIVVLQTADITLDSDSSFTPISNTYLFGANLTTPGHASFNGNDKKIINLTIDNDAGGELGLFAHTNCDLNNITIVNPRINSSTDSLKYGVSHSPFVGALAGRTYGGDITNCCCRLEGTAADNYTKYWIHGNSNVGGLIGESENTDIKLCYAAVNVFGNYYVGGLVGDLNHNSTASMCYSSGDVWADMGNEKLYSGGFAGLIHDNSKAEYCYTTSNVTCAGDGGGFAGYAGYAKYCYSYGRVLFDVSAEKPGNPVLTDNKTYENSARCGGFLSVACLDELLKYGELSGSNFQYCAFMSQPGYNVEYENYLTDEGISVFSYNLYNTLYDQKVAECVSSFPYEPSISSCSGGFPFQPITYDNGKQLPHYGNWPHNYLDYFYYYDKNGNIQLEPYDPSKTEHYQVCENCRVYMKTQKHVLDGKKDCLVCHNHYEGQ